MTPERLVDVPDGRLWTETTGVGPNVVLVHPGLWDARTWDPQVPVLVDAGYRVTRYDLRGYGRSSRLTGEPYSNVRDLVAVLDAAGIERAVVVGCSMGGEVALDVTLAHPERVAGLVVAASVPSGFEATPEEEVWWAERMAPVEDAIEAGEHARAEDVRLEMWAPLGTEDEAGEAIRAIAFDNLHELTMDESDAEALEPPAAGRLDEVAVPTLVLIAEHDPPFMRRGGERIADGIRGARVVRLDTDHVMNLRSPAAFDALLLAFLADLGDR
jgi:pimeloyl-ACP methyl ester carboxylesterase